MKIDRRKQFAIEAPIPRKQPGSLHLSMRSDQEVGQDSCAFSPLLPVCPPCTAREEMRFAGQRLYPDLIAAEECIAIPLRFEMDAQFRVHDITDDE
jgi:hypothetical protein